MRNTRRVARRHNRLAVWMVVDDALRQRDRDESCTGLSIVDEKRNRVIRNDENDEDYMR